MDKVSKISLVDLAGSERAQSTGGTPPAPGGEYRALRGRAYVRLGVVFVAVHRAPAVPPSALPTRHCRSLFKFSLIFGIYLFISIQLMFLEHTLKSSPVD